MASDWEKSLIESQARAVKLAAQYPDCHENEEFLDSLAVSITSLNSETFQRTLLCWEAAKLQLEKFIRDLEYAGRVNGWAPGTAITYLGYALCALREGRLTAALQWLQKGKGAL